MFIYITYFWRVHFVESRAVLKRSKIPKEYKAIVSDNLKELINCRAERYSEIKKYLESLIKIITFNLNQKYLEISNLIK